MRFAIFLGIVLSIWLAQHLYVGWRLWSLPVFSAPGYRKLMIIALVLGFVSYPLGRILYGVGWHVSGRSVEYVGAVWMGALFILLAFLLISEVLTLGGWVFRPWIGPIRTSVVVVALVAAVVAFFSARLGPRVVRLDVPVSDISEAADGLTIAHLSDIHLGTILGPHFWERLVSLTDELAPDMVVITGDLVDGDAGVVEEMLPQLQTLKAPRGVFTVLGNHEYYAGAGRSRKLFREAGFVVLDNQAVEVAPRLFVAGVPDARGSAQTGQPEADLAAALSEVKDDGSVILLQHAPENEEQAAAAGVDVMLNGHTHGGQIWPFNFVVRKAYPHIAGVFQVGAMTQIVSRGTGQWGPPMRLFAPAEIYLITLRKTEVVSSKP